MTHQKNGVRRYDAGELRAPEVLPNGWLRADAFIGRTGILEYRRSDGSVQREYRPPEEHSEATLDSFALVPLTDGHPPVGLLTADNTREFQIGTVQRPQNDGARLRSSVLITDSSAIASARAGKTQISCGYVCDLEFAPGEANGERYDAIQRNVRGNHVALVSSGRAGPDIHLKLDTHDAELIPIDSSGAIFVPPENPLAIKIRIDGVEFEVPESAGQAIAKVEAAHAEAAKRAGEALERERARADAAEANAKKMSEELAAAPARARAEIKARMDLETKVTEILSGKFSADGKSDGDLRRAVVEHVLGLKLDGKGDVYVEAAFDLAVAQGAKGAATASLYSPRMDAQSMTDSARTLSEARAKFDAAVRNPAARITRNSEE